MIKHSILYILFYFTFFTLFSQTEDESLYLNGTSDGIIDIDSDNINTQTTSSRTYEVSFKVEDATLATKQIIMSEGGGDRGTQIYVENGFLVIGAYNNAVQYLWGGTFYRKAITSDTWYHVALVLDNAPVQSGSLNTSTTLAPSDNEKLKFYLDGTLIGDISGYSLYSRNVLNLGYRTKPASYPNCVTWTTDNDSEYCFDSSTKDTNQSTNPFYFNGFIYSFRIWDDVRTSTEITNNMSANITTVGTDDLLVALNGNGISYVNDGGTVEFESEQPTPDSEIAKWFGNTDTNWNVASNWRDNEIPETTFSRQEIIIRSTATNFPVIEANSIIPVEGQITIQSGANITINNGGNLEVNFDMINNGTVNIENGGSLILKNSVDPSGTFNIKRTTPTYNSNDFYSYWSSPVVASDSDISTVFPDAELIYLFDASSTNSSWVLNGTTNFEPGIGYAVQNEGTGGQTRTFSGEINNGNIEVDIYNSTNETGTDVDGDSWSTSGDNLVGNPYPSAIDWDLVMADADNSDIDGTIYLWNQQSTAESNNVSDYIQYTATGGTNDITTGTIGTAQGFFVRTSSSGASLTFKPEHQVTGSNTTFYKTIDKVNEKKRGRSWFKFIKEDKINTVLIGFVDGATKKYDRIYDAPFDTNQTSLGFYSILEENEKASIQGLPELNTEEEIVKLGFVVDQTGDYTIDIQNEYIDDNYTILLHDTENDELVNLRESQYDFTINDIGENNSRFEVIYKQANTLDLNDVSNQTEENKLSVIINEANQLVISYISDSIDIKTIDLFNIQGVKINEFKDNQTKNLSTLSNGVYIVHVTLSNNKKIAKKIIVLK